MNQQMLEAAIEAVLQDPKTVKSLAQSVAKEIMKEKANPSNLEESLVKAHVIFGEEGSSSAEFMTAKEVRLAILEFNPDEKIRPRVFGKALLDSTKVTKKSSLGQVYLVEAVVEEINSEVLENIDNLSNNDASDAAEENLSEMLEEMSRKQLLQFIKDEELNIKTKGKDEEQLINEILEAIAEQDDQNQEEEEEEEETDVDYEDAEPEEEEEEEEEEEQEITQSDLNDMDLMELLEVNKEVGAVKKKKAKKMDADELREKLIKFFDFSPEPEPEEEEEEQQSEVDVALLISAVNDFDDIEEYEDWLKSRSRKALIKHINAHKMPIITEEKSDKQIVKSIIKLMEDNMQEEDEPAEKQGKKGKDKKGKKNSKKNKNK